MINKEEVKSYLRIPYDDDDGFIEEVIQLGYDYLKDAVDDFDIIYNSNEVFKRKCDCFVKTMWCPMIYDEREGMTAGKPELGYSARALLTQIQLYKVGD